MLAKPKSWSQREGFKSTSLAALGFRNLSYSFFLSGALSEWEVKDFHQQPSEMLLQNAQGWLEHLTEYRRRK